MKKHTKFNLMVLRLTKARRAAAKMIQKFIRGWLVRKDLKFLKGVDHKKLIIWRHCGKDVRIIGNFTMPPWEEEIHLRYTKYLEEFISTILYDRKIKAGAYCIKFIIDGVMVCNGDLAISQDSLGNYNNVIGISDDKKNLSRSLSVRSFIGVGAVNDELSKHIVTQDSQSPIILARSLTGSLDSPRAFGVFDEKKPKSPISLLMSGSMAAKSKKKSAQLTSQGSADAYFLNEEIQSFGIADGVGEWSTYGLDASRFSKELIRYCEQALVETLQSEWPFTEYCDLLQQVVFEAYRRIVSYGSSTILLAICRDSFLHSLSLGDSSFIVLRPRDGCKVLSAVYRSVEQQHSFNCPYQLANLPKQSKFQELIDKGFSTLIALLKRTSQNMNDSVFDAESGMIPLKNGDIIVAGTDGLFDNMYDSDIIKIAEQIIQTYDEAQQIADVLSKTLVERAIQKGWDQSYKSPFAKNASKAGKKYIGGKLDDTTVIVAVALSL
ncbi:unnamed protein product [Blepharisma stoltei]|uniref:Protein phosphatase n=1 Tax=Blepharisma stoltei TaxID=1481888 RepID=A0AAU9ILX6_9CILI|nr:unnamed protein product [Blepharisma stoltei]